MKWWLVTSILLILWEMSKEEHQRHPVSNKLLGFKKGIGLTSRGDLEEYWCAIKHTLHLESHLEEMISVVAFRAEPGEIENLMKALDEARSKRQHLVSIVMKKERERAGSSTNNQIMKDYWCAVKHLLLTEGHIEEMIANAARLQNPWEIRRLGVELANTKARRINLVERIVEAEKPTNKTSHQCDRCVADL